MDKTLFIDNIVQFFVVLYLSIWFGTVLPPMLESKALDYITLGITGAVILILSSIVLIIKINITKVLFIGLVLLNLVCSIWSMLNPAIWNVVLLSFLQGLLLGLVIRHTIDQRNIHSASLSWTLGLFVSILFLLTPLDYTIDLKPNGLHLGHLVQLLISLLVLLGWTLFKRRTVYSDTYTNIDRSSEKILNIYGHIIIGLFLIIEVDFFFWAVVLKDNSQSAMYQLTLPITLFIIIILRKYAIGLLQNFLGIGYLFVLSIFLTLSLGLFYTFDITLVFVIFFVLAIGYAPYMSAQLFSISWDLKKVGVLLIANAIFILIGSLYIQNHIEFIQSIKMPENVLHLSARQAWVKELASLSGLVMIATGIVFLYRRKWLGRIVG